MISARARGRTRGSRKRSKKQGWRAVDRAEIAKAVEGDVAAHFLKKLHPSALCDDDLFELDTAGRTEHKSVQRVLSRLTFSSGLTDGEIRKVKRLQRGLTASTESRAAAAAAKQEATKPYDVWEDNSKPNRVVKKPEPEMPATGRILGGQSINPDINEHTELVVAAGCEHLERDRLSKVAWSELADKVAWRIELEADEGFETTASATTDGAKLFSDEYDDEEEETSPVKSAPKRKLEKQRKRFRAHLQRLSLSAQKRKKKEFERTVLQLESILKEFQEAEELARARQEFRAAMREATRAAKKEGYFLKYKLGRVTFVPMPTDVLLPEILEESGGSLRRLRLSSLASCPTRDVWESLVARRLADPQPDPSARELLRARMAAFKLRKGMRFVIQ